MSPSKSAAQQCPICRAIQPLEATRCDTCGALLPGIPTESTLNLKTQSVRRKLPLEGPAASDWDEGEADLHEGSLPTFSIPGLLVILVTIALVVCAGVLVVKVL